MEKKYTKQRLFWVSLLRKTKRNYIKILNETNITDNKFFSKTRKPILSNESITNERIILLENENFFRMIIKLQKF